MSRKQSGVNVCGGYDRNNDGSLGESFCKRNRFVCLLEGMNAAGMHLIVGGDMRGMAGRLFNVRSLRSVIIGQRCR